MGGREGRQGCQGHGGPKQTRWAPHLGGRAVRSAIYCNMISIIRLFLGCRADTIRFGCRAGASATSQRGRLTRPSPAWI